MTRHARFSYAAFATALAATLTFTACGKGTAVSPSTGANINGVVRASAPAGLSVTVVGTSASTTTSTTGTFSLAGVPASTSVQLHITGHSDDATANLGQIGENEQVEVHVSVSGNTASVDDEKHVMGDGTAEIEGAISAADGANRALTVGSFSIKVPSGTTITLHGSTADFSALTVGLRIKALGSLQGNVLTASSIKLDDDGEDGGN